MDFTERVKFIREKSGLNQADFAASLGLSRDSYANFEYDRLKSQNAKNPTIIAICKIYRVNEHWLRTGEGEPFKPLNKDEQLIDFINNTLECDNEDIKKRLITWLSGLDSEEWKLIDDMITKLVEENKKEH